MRFQLRLGGLAVAVLALSGCDDQPKTYPVSGKLVVAGGDVKQLAGHYVEIVKEGDPNTRAAGPIGPDGAFSLETLHAGVVLKGVLEGRYQARILRSEEDDDGKKLKKPPVAPRFLQFQTSGLSVTVPASGELTLEVKQR